MDSGRWFIDRQTMSIQFMHLQKGVLAFSGATVWQAEFDLMDRIEDLHVHPPSHDLPELKFSAGLASFNVRITTDSEGFAVLGLFFKSSKLLPPLFQLPVHDQVVHDDTWICLDSLDIGEVKSVLQNVGVSLGARLTSAQALALVWREGVEYETGSTEPKTLTNQSLIGIDELVVADLYPYQREGVQRLVSLFDEGLGCLLADEMGLGKTMQIIALLTYAAHGGQSLVVCPASTMANWRRELSMFAPHLSVHIHQGPKRAGTAKLLQDFDVVVTSYETMSQDVHFLKSLRWSVTAFDEAQYLKNHYTERSRSARLLKSRSVIAVTGTPIENSLRDLWSITELIAPSYLPSLQQFQNLFPDETWAARSLGQRVAPLVIRRSVAEVATDLPERVDTYVPISMGNEHAQVYETIRSSSAPVLSKITSLRQCAATAGDDLVSSKYQFLMELCIEAFSRSKKVLIFASFTNVLDQIAEGIRKVMPSVFVDVLDGRSPIPSRQSTIDAFTDFQGSAALVLNPKAAGVGLNIQAASYVIHFSPEWNPAVVDQASARSHRRGQRDTVFVYYLYFEASVEEVMVERLMQKRDLQKDGLLAAAGNPSDREIERILSTSPTGGAE